MKQDDIDNMMDNIDKKCKLPKHWDEFIEKNSKAHHLIIKDSKNKELYCTNCNQYFTDKTIKVRDYKKCPCCHEKSVVYGMNYYMKSFEQSVILVQRMNKQIVIRVFEIYSYFNKDSKILQKHYIEYARILPGIGRFIGNNVDIGLYGTMRIYHGYKKLSWYKYKGRRFFTDYPTYPYNKKSLVKGTNMEYAPINEFLDRFSYYSYNYLDVLELAAYGSFELLWNMKLYNLCFYSKALNRNGSFYKRFGVPKNFLKFMQENNISYRELKLLQLFQKADKNILQKYRYENINHLKYLIKNEIFDIFMSSNNTLDKNHIGLLKEISKFIPLKKLKNYPKGLNNLHIYNDYLSMSKKLALNYKSKKDLFPRNLMARHDKMQKQIKVTEDMNTQFGAYLRFLELSKYIYEDDKYMIFPAPSIDDLKDEGQQQGNCVGNMYLNPYVQGETEIFFIREISNFTKSFITLEFKNGKVKQKELPHHSQNFTQEHKEFIDKWVMYRSFVDQREKYRNKPTKVTKYKLEKLVA